MTVSRDALHRLITHLALASLLVFTYGCGGGSGDNKPSGDSSATAAPASDDATAGKTGDGKLKPAAGTGNVQGKVLYNGKPAAGIEVMLCQKFNRFLGGCDGQSFQAVTDASGEYVITNVPPKEYESLLAKVFDTDSYVFATSGIGISSAKYEVVADKTLFVDPTNLFKSDLHISNPKAGSQVSAQNLALSWEPYPDASYYKFSLYPDSIGVNSPYINQRVDSTVFNLTKPLENGGYRIQVEAYNGSDIKLAESPDDITFTVD
jgi:hypothetical protein